jgi:hypothetical protein
MKTRPLTNDEFARRQLNHKGYLLSEGRVHVVTETGATYLTEMCGDATETFQRLEQAGWPKVEGEIPCDECGELQPQLGGLCLRCASNYHGVE